MADDLRQRIVNALLTHLPRSQFTPAEAKAHAARLADHVIAIRDSSPDYWRERAEKAERQVRGCEAGIAHLENRVAHLERRAANAEERLALAREALLRDGYFTPDQVGPDIAPRIAERLAALDDQEADRGDPRH